MAIVNLKNMDVDALLTLRADVEKAVTERGRDLQRQLALLGGEVGKRRGRPPGPAVRHSAMKGALVAHRLGPLIEGFQAAEAEPSQYRAYPPQS